MANLYYTRWWNTVTRTLAVLGIVLFAALIEFCARVLQDDIDSTMERYATAFVLTQGVLLVVLVFGLVVGKSLRLRWERRREAKRGEIEEMIVAYAAGQNVEQCAARLREWYADTICVMGRAMNLLHGSACARLEELLIAGDFVPPLIRDAADSDPTRAIQAVTLLGRLYDPRARSAVERALSHPMGAVRVAGCRAILARGSADAQLRVLAELPRLPAWQRIVLFHLMPIESPVLLGFLQEALTSGDDAMRLVALEFILSRRRALLAICPAELATAANNEVRIKFFRALPFLHLETSVVDILRLGVADADWRVRAMTARACGYFHAAELAPDLHRMCAADRNPVEAGHAASALTRLGGHVWERLQPHMSSGGEMVRRVAAEAMEKSMLAAPMAGRGHP